MYRVRRLSRPRLPDETEVDASARDQVGRQVFGHAAVDERDYIGEMPGAAG